MDFRGGPSFQREPTSAKRLSLNCVRLTFCTARATRPQMRSARSRERSEGSSLAQGIWRHGDRPVEASEGTGVGEQAPPSCRLRQNPDCRDVAMGVHQLTEPIRLVSRVTFGRAGHLKCTCPGFTCRGNCKHVREVREKVFED